MSEMAAQPTAEPGAIVRRGALYGRPRPLVIVGVALVLLGCLGVASLMYGAVNLSLSEVWSGLTSDSDIFARNIVWKIRYPRLVDGMIVGAALAVSGSLLQGVTRNPLADPTILGVTAAAGLASAVAIVINPQIPQWGIAMSCVGGGLFGAGLLFFIAWRGGSFAGAAGTGGNCPFGFLRRGNRCVAFEFAHLPPDQPWLPRGRALRFGMAGF